MKEFAFILDILKLSISGIIVFFVGWYFVQAYIKNLYSYKLIEIKKASQEQLLPLRLQAYERIILFLERINPDNMLVRLHGPGLSALEMQNLILSEIRAEYHHNITQQLYVSHTSWTMVKKVKENTIGMVNNAIRGLPKDASALILSKAVLSHLSNLEGENPYDLALKNVKNDIQQIF
jgi:hypothetical protein